MICPSCGTPINGNPDHCPICMHEFLPQSPGSGSALITFLVLSIMGLSIIFLLFFSIIIYAAAYLLLFPWAIFFIVSSFIFAFSLRHLEKFYARNGEHRYSSESGASFIGQISLIAFGIMFMIHTVIAQFLYVNFLSVTFNVLLAYLSAFVFAIFQLVSLVYGYGFLKFGKHEGNTGILYGGFIFMAGGLISGVLIWESGIIFTPLINLPLGNIFLHLQAIREILFSGMFLSVVGLFTMLLRVQRKSESSF